MNRRRFVRNSLIAASGVALVGRNALGKPTIGDPLPINVGPAPLWEDFQYVIHGWDYYSRRPKLDPIGQPNRNFLPPRYHGTAGWKGRWNGQQYGDYIVSADNGLFIDEDFILDVKLLLKEQADAVRHELIKQGKYPCFCRMCKVRELVANDQGNGVYISGPDSLIALTFNIKEHRGVFRAKNTADESAYRRAFMALHGPTNGYA